MARKKSEPVSGLRKLISESPFVWNEYRYGHDWSCPSCGEQVFNSNYKGRLKLSQFAAENNTRGITKKAQDHLVNGCAPAPRLAERKDLDN